jgi:hypothetical protein
MPSPATRDPKAVENEARITYSALYPSGDSAFIVSAFEWAIESFNGRRPGYQAIDARYHDLEHTLQGTLCLIRLLRGRHQADAQPSLPERTFRLGILAILLHDTGYLKKTDDLAGTGAKYTITHVARSADFAAQLLSEKGFDERDVRAVQNMIRCTGLSAKLSSIPFETEMERMTGYALATADLLGQMAAEDYVEKLPILFSEFVEAASFSGDKAHFISNFTSARDLVQKTPGFWESSIRPKLDNEFRGLWRFLNQPYPDGPNEYALCIEANMEYIKRRLRTTDQVETGQFS